MSEKYKHWRMVVDAHRDWRNIIFSKEDIEYNMSFREFMNYRWGIDIMYDLACEYISANYEVTDDNKYLAFLIKYS